MDRNQPRMSRDLVKRLSASQRNGVNSTAFSRSTHISFSERQRVDKNRRAVGRYGDSLIIKNTDNPVRRFGAEIYHTNESSNKDKPADKNAKFGDRIQTDKNRPSAGFQEPAARPYHPYS